MLRPVLAALLLLGAAQAMPMALAQGLDVGPTPILEDAAGDVAVSVNGAPVTTDPAAIYSGADLVGLALAESRSDVTFVLTFGDLKSPDEETAPDGMRTVVLMAHNGREFMLEVGRGVVRLSTEYFSYLSTRDDPAGGWSRVWTAFGETRPDYAAETLTLALDRDLLADADGAAPYPGRSLEGIRVASGSQFRDTPLFNTDGLLPLPDTKMPAWVEDHMPDDPAASVAYAVQVGVAQTGHARLASAAPFRASNGEATTFLYNVTATNLGDAEETFELSATGVDPGHAVVLPVPALKLEAGAARTVPVLLTMPFSHQHGSVATFLLELRSLADAGSVGRLEMGVRFLEVPQPAGHHDTVYFHTNPPDGIGPVLAFTQGYMNTQEDDAGDQGADYHAGGSPYPTGADRWKVSWPYYLQPGLEMGLDVDPGKVGLLSVSIGSVLPAAQANIAANLYVELPPEDEDQPFERELVHLATMDPTADAPLPGGGASHRFEGPLVPGRTGRMPYAAGSNLVLWITMEFQAPGSLGWADETPFIQPGGFARLPLREWHDAVDDVLSGLGGPGLSPLGAQERLVNPGKAAAFPFSIANPLGQEVRMRLEATGLNIAWADFPPTLHVPANGVAQGTVLVRAPPASQDGERADLVLQAYPEEDPTARGLLRLVAEVDTDAEHPDDSALAPMEGGKDSPGPGLSLALAALAALAFVRRRAGRP